MGGRARFAALDEAVEVDAGCAFARPSTQNKSVLFDHPRRLLRRLLSFCSSCGGEGRWWVSFLSRLTSALGARSIASSEGRLLAVETSLW